MSEMEKLIEFYYGSLQAVRRAQKYYLAFLLALLAFVWVCYWGKPEKAMSVSLLGMPVAYTILLGVAPGISTILLLGWMGCLRAVQPALHRLQVAWRTAGATTTLDLPSIDNHQNWVDYSAALWSSLFGHVFYGVILAASIASTLAVGLILVPKFKGYDAFFFASYSFLCLGAQLAASWSWIAERFLTPRRSASLSREISPQSF
jgi:hypothetical protein